MADKGREALLDNLTCYAELKSIARAAGRTTAATGKRSRGRAQDPVSVKSIERVGADPVGARLREAGLPTGPRDALAERGKHRQVTVPTDPEEFDAWLAAQKELNDQVRAREAVLRAGKQLADLEEVVIRERVDQAAAERQHKLDLVRQVTETISCGLADAKAIEDQQETDRTRAELAEMNKQHAVKLEQLRMRRAWGSELTPAEQAFLERSEVR